jgi:hypothetical protein
LATSTEWGDSGGGTPSAGASNGFTNRAAGRKDCTFTTEGKYDSDNEVWDLFEPEDIAAIVLLMAATVPNYNFPRALCTDFSLAVNVDTEEVIGWTASWGTDGTYTGP